MSVSGGVASSRALCLVRNGALKSSVTVELVVFM